MTIDPQILNLLADYRYWILFPLVVIEGPIAMIAGGFLASAGDMKLHWVIILSILGDLLGDYGFYYLGKYGGRRVIQKWGKYTGLNESRFEKLEHMFHKHRVKTLILGKVSHTLGLPILVTAGIVNVKLSEFTLYNGISTVVKALFLIFLGYYYGHAYVNIFKYLKWGYNGFLILIVLAFIIYFGLKYISNKIDKSEKNL